MTNEEKVLIDKYLGLKEAERETFKKSLDVLKELSALAPHKVGEIIKWTENKVRRVGGSDWRPVYKELPPVERKAVLKTVKADIYIWHTTGGYDFKYIYEFYPIKKDGTISQQSCHPNSNYEWTDETYKEEML